MTEVPVVLRSGVRADLDGCGHLLTPQTGSFLKCARGVWACDNDCFNAFQPDRYVRMLAAVRDVRGCKFVALPDVVTDWESTRRLFAEWLPVVRAYTLPAAIVLQDGCVATDVPWNEAAAIFIGGSTEFKLSTTTASIAGSGRARGKWVHMGRVNSAIRFHYATSIGCHSIDGSTFSWFPREGERRLRKWRQNPRLPHV